MNLPRVRLPMHDPGHQDPCPVRGAAISSGTPARSSSTSSAARSLAHTEFYDPVTLGPGEALYIDSSMGHACLVVDCDEAEVLAVMSSAEEELMESLLTLHEEPRQGATAASDGGDAPGVPRRVRKSR